MDDPAVAESNDEVRAFFTQWQSYKTAAEENYLHHREAYAAVRERLRARGAAFTLLELACGDSSNTVGALAGLPVSDYTGVDFSKPALELARETIGRLTCPARLVEGDFVTFLAEAEAKWDVIFVGLSYHHLTSAEKPGFAAQVRARLNAGGVFIFFEPVFREGESAAAYLERWGTHIRAHWTKNTPEELASFYDHVSHYDHPETVARFQEIVREAGFASARVLYTDPEEFYAVICGEA